MRILFFTICVFMLFSCKENQTTPQSDAQVDSASKEPLYPYPQYISGQIAYVDTVLLAIEMLVDENGSRIDSALIGRDKFHELAKEFLLPDPNTEELRPQYEEKSFQDLTINSVTFSITAKNKNLPIQQADILLVPETKKVKNIIIKKHMEYADSSVSKTLLWVHNMNFQIISSISRKDGTKTDRVVKVIWDKPINF